MTARKRIGYRDVAEMRRQCQKIHAFGLGFIQIKIDDELRFHCYTARVPNTALNEIHSHRYDFNSTVRQGRLDTWIHTATPDENGKWLSTVATCKDPTLESEGEEVFAEPTRVDVKLLCDFQTSAGSRYFLAKDALHWVSAQEGTITEVRRSGVMLPHATVVRHDSKAEVCPFSANQGFTENQLWEIYASCIEGRA